MAQLYFSKLFSELSKVIPITMDEISKQKKELFDKTVFEDYLTWDSPTISTLFEEIIGEYNITVAAPTIDEDSAEPIVGTRGLKTMKERMLTHAINRPLPAKIYRKILELMDSKVISTPQLLNELIKTLIGEAQDVVNGVNAKLDAIFLEAISNEGVFNFTSSNNPEGITGTIDYGMPSGNKATSSTAWTKANISTVDCFSDIQDILDASQDKVTFDKILIAPRTLSYLCRTTQVHKAIWGDDAQSRIVTPQMVNQYMESNGFPIFVPVRRQVGIQQAAGGVKNITPFNASRLVFLPKTSDGKIGTVKNAWADAELNPEPDVTYGNYGRILVSQWTTGESKNEKSVMHTKATSTSLPVISSIEGIYSLNTQLDLSDTSTETSTEE